jgi:hypothetical protein
MVQQYSFDALSRFVVAAVVAGLPLLASSVACQSGSGDDESTGEADPNEGAAGARAASPSPTPTNDPSPDDRSSPTVRGGGASDGDAPAAAGAAGSPAGASDPASAGASAGATGVASSATAAAAQAFEACATSEGAYGGNCDIIYVTVKQASPTRCVQLTIDNCGGYNNQGLPIDAPTSWRLASGSIGSSLDDCDLGVFDPEKTGVADAEGTITWNELTPVPTELILDLTLSPSSSARDTTSVRVATSEPLNPIACEP